MPTLLSKIKTAQPSWFSEGNRRFFNDVRFYAYRNKKGTPFLVQETYRWSDMFGQPRTLAFMVHTVNPETFEIDHMLETAYPTLQDAKDYIEFY